MLAVYSLVQVYDVQACVPTSKPVSAIEQMKLHANKLQCEPWQVGQDVQYGKAPRAHC